jgi:putative SOS response-associated peptidase YedK
MSIWTMGSKQEFLFTLPNEPVFLLAGLWERVHSPAGPVDTFAFMTTAPGDQVRPYHPKAELVILEGDDWKAWFDHSIDPIPLIRPSWPNRMAIMPVKEIA